MIFRRFLPSFLIITLFSIAPFNSTSALAKDEPLNVTVTPLSDLLISAKLSAPANIISLNHSTISAEITGRVLKIKVEIGDIIEKDQKLASIDCRSYSLARKQAKAALKVAKTQFNYSKKQLIRNQNLVRKGIISREIFEKSEAGQLSSSADIALQRVSIETADLAISRCQIKAPFSGQITSRLVQKGQLVTAGTPLFKLIQSNRLEIQAKLSPKDVKKLKESPSLEFVAGDTKLKATVRSIIQTIDETTRTQEVRLSLPENTNIATGLSGRLVWSNKAKRLPAEFLIRRNNQLGVMVAEDIVEGIGKGKFIPLTNAHEGQPADITLPKNTAIINQNRYRAKDGQQLKVQP
ncbi:MAG: efflux RND transporter periplasmic adaptor subunit [Cocleimonas sp.]|nr:efflux RND transporter periplasmic adaptor subunit [Cocleimonas sp.]